MRARKDKESGLKSAGDKGISSCLAEKAEGKTTFNLSYQGL